MIYSLSLLQIISAIFALGFLISAMKRFIAGEAHFSLIKFITTFAVWGSIFFLSLFPELARVVSAKMHIGENLNTLIFLGFVVVFAIIFRLLRTIEKLEKDITHIIRDHALQQNQKIDDGSVTVRQ